MKTAVFAFSRQGAEASLRIAEALCDVFGYDGDDIEVYIKSNDAGIDEQVSCILNTKGIKMIRLKENDWLNECVGSAFSKTGALIFVCAAGIAVRLIAPFIVHKAKDPAVLVLDEKLGYCIPLLSGHIGGANELAVRLSDALGSVPVITTASDINGMTAVDMFAKKNDLVITDLNKAKELTCALLNGTVLYVTNEAEDVTGRIKLPDGYEYCNAGTLEADKEDSRYKISIKYREDRRKFKENEAGHFGEDTDELILIPRCLRLGIGCKRGVSADRIEAAFKECFNKHELYTEAVEGVYSIDLKKDEEGILAFCDAMGTSFKTYSSKELSAVKGAFSSSDFVKDTTGVDNVCERSAMMNGGRLIVNKESYNGITLAVAACSICS